MRRVWCGVVVGLLLWSVGEAAAQPVALLIVDETQTLQASLMVQAFAKALQDTGLFDLEAKFVTVQSSYDDPLGVNATDKQYELIVIVPRGIEDGSVPQIWLITRPIGPQTRPELLAAIELIRQRVAHGSAGLFTALTVMDDGALGIFSSVFERHGWLK